MKTPVARLDAEIGVVGAGPAGARAAELLAEQGADVILWDPKAPWEKPCGGGLTSAAFESVPMLREVRPQARRIDRVRVDNGAEASVEIELEEHLWIVPRVELARWQLGRAEAAGAVLEPTAVKGIERTAGTWKLTLADGRTRAVRRLVGADGATSTVRRAVAPTLSVEMAPTRVAFAPGTGPWPDAVQLRFFRGVVGYLWDFPRPDHRSVGVGVSDSDWRRPEFDREIRRYLGDGDWDEDGRTVWAGAVIGTAGQPHPRGYAGLGRSDYALLGDAAGLADPAFGEGIQNALRSAEFAAEAYERDGTFASYAGRAYARLEPEFRRYRAVRRFLLTRDVPDRLLRGALRNRGILAVIRALVNWENGHEPGFRLPHRWLAELSALLSAREAA